MIVTVNLEQKASWHAKARAAGMNLSDYVRLLMERSEVQVNIKRAA